MKNRPIKFKAWDSELLKMKKVLDIHLETGAAHLEHEDGSHYRCNKFSLVLLQFTGCYDVKGKEIYEGDIVNSPSHQPSKMSVHFIEGGFCMKNGDNYPIDIAHFYPSIGTDLEVVGNIYENPELLK